MHRMQGSQQTVRLSNAALAARVADARGRIKSGELDSDKVLDQAVDKVFESGDIPACDHLHVHMGVCTVCLEPQGAVSCAD